MLQIHFDIKRLWGGVSVQVRRSMVAFAIIFRAATSPFFINLNFIKCTRIQTGAKQPLPANG